MLSGSGLLRRYVGIQAGLEKSFLKQQLDAKLAMADLLRTGHYRGYSR